MKGFYRLYFVAVGYSILDFSVGEIFCIWRYGHESGYNRGFQIEMVVLCVVEYFTLFALCLPLT